MTELNTILEFVLCLAGGISFVLQGALNIF